MDTTDDRVETRNYILSLCSALGAHEELPSADGTRQYSVGDEALGKQSLAGKRTRLPTNNISMSKGP